MTKKETQEVLQEDVQLSLMLPVEDGPDSGKRWEQNRDLERKTYPTFALKEWQETEGFLNTLESLNLLDDFWDAVNGK